MKATFKRDYARVNPLLDAATVLQQIAGWFEECNESHPHSCLGMSSPREFIRTHIAEVSGQMGATPPGMRAVLRSDTPCAAPGMIPSFQLVAAHCRGAAESGVS